MNNRLARVFCTALILLGGCGPVTPPVTPPATPAPPPTRFSFDPAAWHAPVVEQVSATDAPGPSGFVAALRFRPVGGVASAALSPDAGLVAIATETTVTVWSVTTREAVSEWTTPAPSCRVAFSPDASLVVGACSTFEVGEGGATWDDGYAVLWRVGSTPPLWSAHTGFVSDVAFSPRGDLVAVHEKRTASLFEVSTGREVRQLESDESGYTAVTFSPDGSLVIASSARAVRVYETTGGEARGQFVPGTSDVRFSPDGRVLATPADDFIELRDSTTGEVRLRIASPSTPTKGLAFSPDGRLLASEGRDGVVRLWDPDDGRLVDSLAGSDVGGTSLGFSNDGHWLVGGFPDVAVLWHRP